MYTVYCTDTFDGTSWSEKFKTKEEALAYANQQAGTMLVCTVDDPQGNKIHRAGTF